MLSEDKNKTQNLMKAHGKVFNYTVETCTSVNQNPAKNLIWTKCLCIYKSLFLILCENNKPLTNLHQPNL